jgi:AcrR family transcriptional regulator
VPISRRESSLREQKRVAGMRRVQTAALALFAEHGYAEVTIEQIAVAAAVGPATVYRHFGTKEQIVLWDEYDPMLLEEVAERLGDCSPLDAVREAVIAGLGRIYTRDRTRILERAQLAAGHPALAAAVASGQVLLRRGLAQLFLRKRACRDALEAAVIAGALTTAIEAAAESWLGERGRRPLSRHVVRAFDRLARLQKRKEPRRGPSRR